MANSKADKAAENLGKGIGVAAIIIFLVSVVCAAMLPLYFVYLYFSRKSKIRSLEKGGLTRLNFWLSDNQKRRYKALSASAVKVYKNIQQAEAIATEQGIPKNKDGRYSVRSKLGKEIRGTIETNGEILEDAKREIAELKSLPKCLWESANGNYREVKGSIAGLTAFALSLPFTIPKIVSASNSAAQGIYMDYPAPVQYVFWWCLSALIGGTVFWIVKSLSATSFKSRVPSPPLVDLENIDVWDKES